MLKRQMRCVGSRKGIKHPQARTSVFLFVRDKNVEQFAHRIVTLAQANRQEALQGSRIPSIHEWIASDLSRRPRRELGLTRNRVAHSIVPHRQSHGLIQSDTEICGEASYIQWNYHECRSSSPRDEQLELADRALGVLSTRHAKYRTPYALDTARELVDPSHEVCLAQNRLLVSRQDAVARPGGPEGRSVVDNSLVSPCRPIHERDRRRGVVTDQV
jgi:hypothetical protein